MTLLFVEGLARCLYRDLRLLCIVTFFESHGHLESESIETRKLLNTNLMRLRTNKQSLYLEDLWPLSRDKLSLINELHVRREKFNFHEQLGFLYHRKNSCCLYTVFKNHIKWYHFNFYAKLFATKNSNSIFNCSSLRSQSCVLGKLDSESSE